MKTENQSRSTKEHLGELIQSQLSNVSNFLSLLLAHILTDGEASFLDSQNKPGHDQEVLLKLVV